jgi:hypothetical protein
MLKYYILMVHLNAAKRIPPHLFIITLLPDSKNTLKTLFESWQTIVD